MSPPARREALPPSRSILSATWCWSWTTICSWSGRGIPSPTRTSIAPRPWTIRQESPFNPDFTIANDWLHTNFAQGTADGNIILSQRSQDWVIKINYANGTGDGSVIWQMGAGDDFTLLNPPTGQSCGTPNVFPWFTHQHDAAFQFEENASDGGGTIMTVFDDGNTRAAECPAPQNSRGMVLFVDESARQVYMETAGDLGVYSEALGSGQLLAPGDGNLYASYDNGIGNAAVDRDRPRRPDRLPVAGQ